MDIRENKGWTVTADDEQLQYWYHPSALEVQNVSQLTGPCSSLVYMDESKPLEEGRSATRSSNSLRRLMSLRWGKRS